MLISPFDFPRITFGIIVLNGEPFTKYCLRQLYPHAFEIIVVVGGSSKAAKIAPQGIPTDGTLDALREFKNLEDKDNKVQIITRDGFWSEKDEQSQAYAKRATGDYLWQVDIDEFYRHADIKFVRQRIADDPTIDAISFRQVTFWGSPQVAVDSFYLRSDGQDQYHRLFKWRQGYTYLKHRPPTILDETGKDLREKHWITGDQIEKEKIILYHYSLLFPIQVMDKCTYYSSEAGKGIAYVPGLQDWARGCYFSLSKPYRVHNVYQSISWLKRFNLSQPEEAIHMWNDVKSGLISTQLRDDQDVEKLLANQFYKFSTQVLDAIANVLLIPPLKWARFTWMRLINHIRLSHPGNP